MVRFETTRKTLYGARGLVSAVFRASDGGLSFVLTCVCEENQKMPVGIV